MKLVLAVGQHDADYVDAFYGPPEWRKEAEAAKKPLADDRRAGGGARSTSWPRCRCRRQGPATRSCGRCAGNTWRGSSRRCGRGSRCCRARSSPSTRNRWRSTTRWRRPSPSAEFEAVLTQLDGEAARRGLADRSLRSLQAGVRHPEGPRRSRVPGSDPRLPRPRAERADCRCRSASPSNTSPASRGAATTGIRATSRA